MRPAVTLSAFVAGVGTGGTLTGVSRGLRARGLSIKVYAVEPKSSSVLSGGKPGLHGIQGLGAGFVPKVLDTSQIDEVVVVSDVEAERMTVRLCARGRSVRGSVVGCERTRRGSRR